MKTDEIDKTLLEAKRFLNQHRLPKPEIDYAIERAKKFLAENKIQQTTPRPKSKNVIVKDRWGNVVRVNDWVRPGTSPSGEWLY